ncbi:MFS transporter [Prosthecobacter sp.]|uniref:MFS transporter n=1 Tax=Prosthecobacter sp. TaxID=1965333 RepID=UPI003784E246
MSTPPTDAKASPRALATLFFCTAMPMGMWSVPLSNVFKAHERGHLVPWVFATTAVAAFISPLFVGAMADQKHSPVLLLRWLTAATSLALLLTSASLACAWSDAAVLICAQVLALVALPAWSVTSSIVFSQLHDAKAQFGPLRAWATGGWMVGCWVVSFVLRADASLLAAVTAAGLWLVVMALTWKLPMIPPGEVVQHRTWKQILGLDALGLLTHRDHRVLFITSALYCVPLAAFYPYTSAQLRDLGVKNISAVISLGQTTEVMAMLLLSGMLARFRLKWVFLSGIVICVVRFSLNTFNTLPWVMAGTFLHGFGYTLYFITTQIYLEERIDPKWRVRAQALLAMLMSGVGNLIGYLGGGWWYAATTVNKVTDWRVFWWGEAAITAVVCAFFALAYRGRVRS